MVTTYVGALFSVSGCAQQQDSCVAGGIVGVGIGFVLEGCLESPLPSPYGPYCQAHQSSRSGCAMIASEMELEPETLAQNQDDAQIFREHDPRA